jgi:hypothetical protein
MASPQLLLAIKSRIAADRAAGRNPGFIPEGIAEQLDGLLDVTVSYKVYLYKSLSSKPDVVYVNTLEEISELAKKYTLVETFMVTTRVTTKGNKTSESLYSRQYNPSV